MNPNTKRLLEQILVHDVVKALEGLITRKTSVERVHAFGNYVLEWKGENTQLGAQY